MATLAALASLPPTAVPSEVPAEAATPIATLAALASLPPTAVPSALPSASGGEIPGPSGGEIPSASGAVVVPTSDPVDPTAAPPSHRQRTRETSLKVGTQRRLQAILDRTISKGRVAGVQVAVRLPGGQTWLGHAGQAEFEPIRRPIEDDTVFAIASVSKTFIAALILQLAEEGKLELDVPFGRYFRDAPRKDSATIRQLLSHTSGIYDYFANPRYLFRYSRAWLRTAPQPGLLAREHAWTYDEIMGLVKNAYCRPGTCYHYSNTNYIILGRIAEAVGGAPLDRQLRQRFFRPLGLDDTYYQPADVPPADAAHGHWPAGNGYVDHTRDDPLRPFTAAVTAAGAAGAIASTARDLSVWADALYGGKVLSSHSLAEMTRILAPGDYGLGTDVAAFDGRRAYGHRGGLRGFESSMWYFPDAGVSIALLSNQGNWFNTTRAGSTDVPTLKLVKAVLGRAR
jgi:D-alanyl-D-alanine carboxypeptidase